MAITTATELRNFYARLQDTSVGGIRSAIETIEARDRVKDKTTSGTNQAATIVLIASGAPLKDKTVEGERKARDFLGQLDPLGERQLPKVWDAQRRLEDKSVGGVRDAANVVAVVQGAHLTDKTVRGHTRARDQIVDAALSFLQ